MLQRSPEWYAARCGSLGASEMPDVVRKTKSGVSATRANMLAKKLLERLTGVVAPTYQSKAMLDGIEREADARAAYCSMYDVAVETIGLVAHPTIPWTHASPDGVGERLVEIKCPEPAEHLRTLLTEKIDRDYLVQMQWQMACSGRARCDYVSYNPDFPAAMQLYVQPVDRDEAWIAELEAAARKFLAELDEKLASLVAIYPLSEAA